MTSNPLLGKYGAECEELIIRTRSRGVLLIVIDGDRGSSFTVADSTGGEVTSEVPRILRLVADDIEAQQRNIV